MAKHDTDPEELLTNKQLERALKPHLGRSVGSHSLVGIAVYGFAWYLMHHEQPMPANCASKEDLARIEAKQDKLKDDTANMIQAMGKDLERTRNELLIAIAGLKASH